MLEETLMQGLREAGHTLALALGRSLQERGLCADLHILQDGPRLRIVSRNGDVADAETGRAGCPPTGALRLAAHHAAVDVVGAMAQRLKEGFDERGSL